MNNELVEKSPYFAKYSRFISGEKPAIAAIVGLTCGDDGLDCNDGTCFPNSFLNFTAFPYVKPNLVNIGASGSL